MADWLEVDPVQIEECTKLSGHFGLGSDKRLSGEKHRRSPRQDTVEILHIALDAKKAFWFEAEPIRNSAGYRLRFAQVIHRARKRILETIAI